MACGRARLSRRFAFVERLVRRGDLNAHIRSEHELDAGLDHPPEALANPAAGMRGSVEQQPLLVELDGVQRLEPDAIGRLVDHERELGLHSRPYVLELLAHGSGDPLLSTGESWLLFAEGPGGPVERL